MTVLLHLRVHAVITLSVRQDLNIEALIGACGPLNNVVAILGIKHHQSSRSFVRGSLAPKVSAGLTTYRQHIVCDWFCSMDMECARSAFS